MRFIRKVSTKTKIVFVINDFIIGGAQKLLLDTFRFINKDKYEVHLITLADLKGKDTLYSLLPEHVIVHRLGFRGFFDLLSWIKFFKIMFNVRPRVVLSHLFFSNTVSRILKLFGFRFKVISFEHNTYYKKTFAQRNVDRLLSYFTSYIVAVSETVASFTSRQEKIPIEKFKVITNGIDVKDIEEKVKILDKVSLRKKYGIADTDKIIVNVARLTHQKNHTLLIYAFAEFNKSDPRSVLFIVGGGDLKSILDNKIKTFGLEKKVFLMGSQKDVFPFLKMADFFVSTSIIEGFGIAHIEAMACGLPVVTTKTAGPDKFIEESKNGYFVESEVESVKDGLIKMSKSDLFRMGEYAKITASEFDIKRVVSSYEELIDNIIYGVK